MIKAHISVIFISSTVLSWLNQCIGFSKGYIVLLEIITSIVCGVEHLFLPNLSKRDFKHYIYWLKLHEHELANRFNF